MNKRLKFTVLTLLLALPPAAMAQSEDNDDTLRPIIKQHIVVAGDTLANLARKHLGSDAAWDTNVHVNPGLGDTNALAPGQAINIITGYAAPPPPPPPVVIEEVDVFQATIEQIANDVDKNIKQSDWEDASKGDELNPLDAVRTLANSSAVLRFDMASQVLVTEYSQVFLRALEPQDNGTSRSEIEIKRGETELNLHKTDSPQQEIEINIAGTITRPARGSAGLNSTKARIVGDDASQVMVYDGSSSVESGGVSVSVDTGMGTTAIAGQAPAKPERLLSAPKIESEPFNRTPGNIKLLWQAVENAHTYRLDICSDRRCTQPMMSQREISTTDFTVESLPEGIAYWRVTAVSPSGLDGFTSTAAELSIAELVEVPDPYYFLKKLSLLAFALAITFIALFHGMTPKEQ